MNNVLTSAFIAGTLLLSLSSCSLFNVDLNTGMEPLPSKELNTRILLHEFAHDFSNEVEQLADSIIGSTGEKNIKLNALYWKIGAISMSRQAIFQTVPYASLVDTWIFCRQQSHFLNQGAGRELFGEYQPVVNRVAEQLEDEVARIARMVSTANDYHTYKDFVDNYTKEHPFEDIFFSRGSVLSELNAALGLSDSVAVTTIGTMPEAVSDLSSRMNDYSNNMPKIARWSMQAYWYEAGLDSVDIGAMADSIALLASQISYVAEHSPELIDSAVIKLNEQLGPLIDRLDHRWSETLWRLGEERIALIEALDEQRKAIGETVATEREVIMGDLNVLSKELVEQSWRHIKELLVKSLALILLILIVLLGLPFGLGYLTGRTLKMRKIDRS
ncbi:MAG: hypothetical protein MI975_26105 [Cytophagales bacterium]|nr:hypothetical protein [Cytophagales bacterium]